MGLTHIRPLSLLLILAIILVVFGTKRLRSMGRDLGMALKDFRESMSEGAQQTPKKEE